MHGKPRQAALSSARTLGRGRRGALSLGLACVGLIGTVLSSSILVEAWYTWWTWTRSDASQHIERYLEMTSPRWVASTDDSGAPLDGGGEGRVPPVGVRAAVPVREARPSPSPDEPMPRSGEASQRLMRTMPVFAGVGTPVPEASRAPATKSLEVVATELRYFDPPQPGAHVSLGVTVRNRAARPSPPVVIGLSADWFDHYSIIGAIPPVLDDRVQDDGLRYFDFPGVAPGADVAFELHVTAVGEEVRAPMVRLALRGGGSLGDVRPEVVARGLPLGPVRAVSVPRLGIRTGVVETGWEPPPFVAGQISTTAALGEGNSVLVGHRGGLAGDVFVRLAGARRGDEVVASARGVELRYTVSEIRILPGSDSTPIGPTETPRLTLMTCTGAWNPVTGDYSHRLWVVAEPPELARATLAATVAQAGQAAATSASPSEAARLRTDAALARAALSLIDARRPSPP
jgi:LPXTG-site transpeptidase (sortase) family protein